MYPFLRLFIFCTRAWFAPKAEPEEEGEISFYIRPWDIDVFFELNNGRILTLFDLGRFELGIRCGLMKTLSQKKWGLAVAGSTIQYRKRVRMFQKVTIRTKFIGRDEKWIYAAQSMWVKGKPTSAALFRTCITNANGVVPTDEVLAAMGKTEFKNKFPEWAKEWEVFDKNRPWPPEF